MQVDFNTILLKAYWKDKNTISTSIAPDLSWLWIRDLSEAKAKQTGKRLSSLLHRLVVGWMASLTGGGIIAIDLNSEMN